MRELRWFYYIMCVAGATGIEPISTVLETAILTVVLRPYEDAHATDIIAYFWWVLEGFARGWRVAWQLGFGF